MTSIESTTQQRPWAAVAPWPKDGDAPKVHAHVAAMAWAHMLGYQRDLSAAVQADTDDAIRDGVRLAEARHGNPMSAGLPAAGLLIGRDLPELVTVLADADLTGEYLWGWLRAAGIDPDEIAPAS